MYDYHHNHKMNEVPSALRAFSRLVLTTFCLGGKYYYNPHFINKKIRAKRGQVICPKSERWWIRVAMNLNKASLVLEPTHLRRGEKYLKGYSLHGYDIGTYSYWLQDKALEPKNGSYWKNWLIIWKKCIIIHLGVSHRFPPMLFHTISNQIDHFLEWGQLY